MLFEYYLKIPVDGKEDISCLQHTWPFIKGEKAWRKADELFARYCFAHDGYRGWIDILLHYKRPDQDFSFINILALLKKFIGQ